MSSSARRPCRGRSTTGSAPNAIVPEPVAAAGRRVPDRDRDALRDVRLAPVARAERHRRRRVDHEPRDEHALGELDADVRLARARRDVPLDPAHVVARLVGAHLPQLAADARERRAVVAGEQPVDAPADRQLERAQRRRGQRARARLLRRADRSERVGCDTRLTRLSRLRRGRSAAPGPSPSTWSRIVSGATSSASARYESTRRWRNASRTSASRSAGHDVVAATDQRERACRRRRG